MGIVTGWNALHLAVAGQQRNVGSPALTILTCPKPGNLGLSVSPGWSFCHGPKIAFYSWVLWATEMHKTLKFTTTMRDPWVDTICIGVMSKMAFLIKIHSQRRLSGWGGGRGGGWGGSDMTFTVFAVQSQKRDIHQTYFLGDRNTDGAKISQYCATNQLFQRLRLRGRGYRNTSDANVCCLLQPGRSVPPFCARDSVATFSENSPVIDARLDGSSARKPCAQNLLVNRPWEMNGAVRAMKLCFCLSALAAGSSPLCSQSGPEKVGEHFTRCS